MESLDKNVPAFDWAGLERLRNAAQALTAIPANGKWFFQYHNHVLEVWHKSVDGSLKVISTCYHLNPGEDEGQIIPNLVKLGEFLSLVQPDKLLQLIDALGLELIKTNSATLPAAAKMIKNEQ